MTTALEFSSRTTTVRKALSFSTIHFSDRPRPAFYPLRFCLTLLHISIGTVNVMPNFTKFHQVRGQQVETNLGSWYNELLLLWL